MNAETTKKPSDQQAKADDGQTGRGWISPQGAPKALSAGLYVVATPIGNLGDMSFRALDILAGADVVFCEDTRQSRKLFSYFDIQQSLSVYNDHSDERVRAKIIMRIAQGDAVALISDAGMPLVSDPGYKLVSEAQEAGLYVTSAPGANAPLAALQLSGMPSDKFCFLGFLPSKQSARRSVLEDWSAVPATLIMFETAPRLKAALGDIAAAFDLRDVSVIREITKKFEEVRKGKAAALMEHYDEHGAPKGEIVIVIAPPCARSYSDGDIDDMLRAALVDMGTKAAAADVAKRTGGMKKDLYDRALKISKHGD